MKNLKQFILEASNKEIKNWQKIVNKYNLFDNKEWLAPANYDFMNNMKEIFKAYCGSFFGDPMKAEQIGGWYFDDNECVDEKTGRTVFVVKPNMTNAELFVKLYYEMGIDKIFKKLADYMIKMSEQSDPYYANSENVQEFAKLFKEGK